MITRDGVGLMRPEHLLLFVQHGGPELTREQVQRVADMIDQRHPPRSQAGHAVARSRPAAAARGTRARSSARRPAPVVVPRSIMPTTSPRRRVGIPPVPVPVPVTLGRAARAALIVFLLLALIPIAGWAPTAAAHP